MRSIDIFRPINRLVPPALRVIAATGVLSGCGLLDLIQGKVNSGVPSGQEATATLSVTPPEGFVPGSLIELISHIGPTSWDADKSLPDPEHLSRQTLADWFSDVSQLRESGVASQLDIRTHTYVDEVLLGETEAWATPTLSKAISEDRSAWVGMTQAKDLAQLLWDQAGDISVNFPDYSQAQIYNQLRQLVGLNGYIDSEVLATRNTYPDGAATRNSQDETIICSRYEPGIIRGQEFRGADGILHLSNEADFAVVFRVSDHRLTFSDPNVPVLEVRLGNKYLYMRIADLWSQPQVLGVIPEGVAPPDGEPWGSIVGPHCGVTVIEITGIPQPEQGGGQPSIEQTPGQPSQTPPGGTPGVTNTPPQRVTETPQRVTETPQRFPSSTPQNPEPKPTEGEPASQPPTAPPPVANTPIPAATSAAPVNTAPAPEATSGFGDE